MGKADRPETRKRVYDAIRTYPGIHVRGLERHVGISSALVQYHVRKLLDEGFVELHEQGGYSRCYPTSKGKNATVTAADLPLVGLLRQEVPLHVALLLLDRGPMSHGELVAEVGTAKSTLTYHLAKLEEAGVVERASDGVTLRLADRDRVYRLLLAYEPTPDLLDRFAAVWEDLYG